MKRIVLGFFFINMLLASATTFADFEEVLYNPDTQTIHVSGNAGEGMENNIVSVILENDKEVYDIKIVRADKNSDFECNFAVADETKVYEVSYQLPKSEEKTSVSVNVYSKDTVDVAISAFSSAKNIDEMELVFSEYTKILGFSESLLSEVEDRDVLYGEILKKSADVKNAEEAVALVEETAVVQIFNEAEESEFQNLIEKYSKRTGILSSQLYENYTDFQEAQMQDFEEKMVKHTFGSIDDIFDTFEVCTILSEIQNASYYTKTKEMVETYSDKLSVDMDEYNKLTDTKQKNVMKTLTGKNISDALEFGDEWDEAIDVALNKKSGSGSSSSGGSGGGSSSGKKGSSTGAVVVGTENSVPVKVVSFIDIENVSWARDAILNLANKGVINGKSEYRFYPDDNITRAEFVKILIGALGFEIKESECDFYDVTKNHWAYPFVCTAVENKIVTGYSDKEFGANDNITRQDMVTMVMRALNQKNKITSREFELNFDDAALIDDYAIESVKNAVGLGIVNGIGNNRFEPKTFATRAQAAVLIDKCTKAGNK